MSCSSEINKRAGGASSARTKKRRREGNDQYRGPLTLVKQSRVSGNRNGGETRVDGRAVICGIVATSNESLGGINS